ncbi:hypothetical protein FRB95_008325 [Tulasnella sp. JGI-2019a]|nr:hypothetical protein FRB93_008310 [Tulasnella sp. JGI-2019a]KAG9026900.1 hypothetical protein FRB95_008325 [Tulasnella sp. JGI-2019a]
MSKTNQLAFSLFAALAVISSVSSTPVLPPSCDIAEQSPYITATSTDSRISGLQLTQTTGAATLTSSGFHGGWDWVNGGLGAFDQCHDWWLNIGTSSNSVLPLTWGYDNQITTNWAGGPGEVLTTTAAPAQTLVLAPSSTFLACNESGSWVLYLQTGTDLPAGKECVATELEEGTSSL